MPVADILAKVVQGAAGAAGDSDAQAQVGAWQQQRQQQRQDQQKMALAPLSEALQADQTRLALFANPDDPSKPLAGKEDQYNATIERMRQTIGQMRGIVGEKPAGANPVEAGAGNLLDKLHITNHLKNHVAQVRAQNAAKYAGQTNAMTSATATGAIPFAQTPEGQKSAGAQVLESQRTKSAEEIERMRAQSALDVAKERETAKVPKGFKAMEQGGMALGIEDQDTGAQYLPARLGPTGDAPPQAKQIWSTIQAIQAGKEARLDQKDKEAQERINMSQERLAHTLAAQTNQGTWSVAEGPDGTPVLFNSKTGEEKAAPEGMHKSGFYAKQVAPLEAASMNISSYLDGKVYDGPGDLALQHEFFTATQPSTGFRMTKVQQDILQNSQSWLNSLRAKAHHLATGTWFSDEQRRQIAKAAQDAIEAKKKVLNQSSGGPKTDELRKKAAQTNKDPLGVL